MAFRSSSTSDFIYGPSGPSTRGLSRVTCSGDTVQDIHMSRISLSGQCYRSREGSELGEDSHQEFLATLDVQLAVDTPHIRMNGVRREPELLGDALLRRTIEQRSDNTRLTW